MQNINLDDFLTKGIIKEKDFREKVSLINWEKYQDQKSYYQRVFKSNSSYMGIFDYYG